MSTASRTTRQKSRQKAELTGTQKKEIYQIMQKVNKVMKRQNKEIDRIIAKYHLA